MPEKIGGIMSGMDKTIEISTAGRDRLVQIEYKRNRNMYLRVNDDGSLHITCPWRTSEESIISFIQSKSRWIARCDRSNERQSIGTRTGSDTRTAAWLGENYKVEVVPFHLDRISVDEEHRIIRYSLAHDTEEVRNALFYKAAGKKLAGLIAQERGQWDREICMANGKKLPSISLRYMTSRWGSCTPGRSTIRISLRLIHYPLGCLQYVLLHEYTHILVPNHSSAFYDVVERFMPEWKSYNRLLK